MKNIKVFVNAKINLSLGILGTTKNNYHILESVMASVNLSDAVSLVKRRDKNIYLSGANIAVSPHNSAVRAANAFITAFDTPGVDISLRKNIPFSAGLGGSSADAAAVIAGMGKLFSVTDKNALNALAESVGSDVKYMLGGGYALMSGMGESVEKIHSETTLFCVIAKPDRGVSTAQCYAEYDRIGGDAPPDTQKMIEGLRRGDLGLIAANTVNNLEKAAVSLLPDIGEIKALLNKEKPLSVFMTGSGSAVVALCKSREQADFIAARLRGRAAFAGSFETAPHGIRFE